MPLPFDVPSFDRQSRLLLHCCCAPCAGSVIERLSDNGVRFSVFFYNPNIHPENEYIIRKNELMNYISKIGIQSIDGEYDPKTWFDLAQGYEHEPEQGLRCRRCFEHRLTKTAQQASNLHFRYFSTTLGISRQKNLNFVTEAGKKAAEKFPDTIYLEYNWRKQGGSQRMDEIAQQEMFYRQTYCGCVYSLRNT